MARNSSTSADAAGLAALSICEALALALAEEGIMPKDGICGAIEDAIAAHRDAMRWAADPDVHRLAASLAERIRDSIKATARSDGAD